MKPKGDPTNQDNIYSHTADSLCHIVNFTRANLISAGFKSGGYRYMPLICPRLAVQIPQDPYDQILSLQTSKESTCKGNKELSLLGALNPMVHC